MTSPTPKRWARRKRGVPDPTPEEVSDTVAPKFLSMLEPISDVEIEEYFRKALLRFVMKCDVGFYKNSRHAWRLAPSEFLNWLGLRQYREERDRILKVVDKAKFPKATHFAFQSQDKLSRGTPGLVLSPGSEWEDARTEARSMLGLEKKEEEPRGVNRILAWVREQKEARFVGLDEIGPRLSEKQLSDLVQWIQRYREPCLTLEKQNWKFRLIVQKELPAERVDTPLNPVMPAMPSNPSFDDLQAAKCFFEDIVLASGRSDGNQPLLVLRVATHREMRHSFPNGVPNLPWSEFPDFLYRLPTIPGIRIYYDFEDGIGPWILSLQPAKGLTWKEALQRIENERSEVSMEERYGLSTEAARLLQWLLRLPPEAFFHGLSPVVENLMKVEIGLKSKGWAKNESTLLNLLADEIASKTEYELKLVRWEEYGQQTRILFRPRRGTKGELADRLRVHAAMKGVVVSEEKALRLLDELCCDGRKA